MLLPNWKGTRAIFEPIWPLAFLALAHSLIVIASPSAETGTAPLELFNKLFDANEDGLATYLELGSYRNFAAEEWTHVLIWDLFVGRYIWLDGRKRGIFTSHSTLLTNLIGDIVPATQKMVLQTTSGNSKKNKKKKGGNNSNFVPNKTDVLRDSADKALGLAAVRTWGGDSPLALTGMMGTTRVAHLGGGERAAGKKNRSREPKQASFIPFYSGFSAVKLLEI